MALALQHGDDTCTQLLQKNMICDVPNKFWIVLVWLKSPYVLLKQCVVQT